jgi:hypothetical protein
MTPQQRSALEHLGRLTETGRSGGDPAQQCVYEVGGLENGIQLFQMGVTDADMRHFDLLPEWHFITLRECPVSDAGLKYLANQKGLRFLDIGETEVTTVHPLRECVRLQQLWCDRLEKMTDRKAVALAGFRDLWFLDLAWAGIGDATAGRLASLTELRKLYLVGTKITDEGLESIGRLPKLEVLNLHRTGITDEGLRHLHGLPKLRLVGVGETQVTNKGRAALQRACPDLKVVDHTGY